MSVPEPLSKHLPPKLNEARLARQYAAITARARPGAARRMRVALAAPLGFALAGALAALLVVWIVRRSPGESRDGREQAAVLVDGTWLESATSGTAPAVTLADGSRVALAASSRVRLTSTRADAIRLDVARGRVDVQATHVAGRSFVVGAREYEVRVVGTRFSVQDDGRVRVRVDEGRVEVRGPSGNTRVVSAGEEWAEEPVIDVDASIAISDDDASAQEEPSAPAAREPRRHTSAGSPSAKDLLDDAQQATARGERREAARLFDEIRKHHRGDPRAALAAFELGRIRLDALGDPAGAEEAFRDAIRLAREPGLREDAEARRVEALERSGNREACARARDAYLARHPDGVHRAAVTARCSGP